MMIMPVYSVPVPESIILKAIEGAKKVRIIGCGLCDNWSLAYLKKQPVNEIMKRGDKTIRVPYSLSLEANHYKKLLEEKDVECDIEFIPMLCQYSTDPDLLEMSGNAPWTRSDFVDRCKDSDAVLCFGCGASFMGLKKRVGDDVKVVPGLRSVGALQIQTYMDESKKFIMLDREGSTVIRYREQ